jgi:hypothetical protein
MFDWHVYIAHLSVFSCIAVRCVPTQYGPVLFGSVRSSSVQHTRSYLALYYSIRIFLVVPQVTGISLTPLNFAS